MCSAHRGRPPLPDTPPSLCPLFLSPVFRSASRSWARSGANRGCSPWRTHLSRPDRPGTPARPPLGSVAPMESWRSVSVPELPGQAPEPRIRDTASGELAVAAAGRTATLYACGITPYDATHIGHAATYIAWDLLVRAWRDSGHEVSYVQNVTDVDDPLLERAARDGEDWLELARREIDLYRADMAALRVLAPASLVGAVEALGIIERFNHSLAGHGALYELDGDMYFARTSDPAFGTVSGLELAILAHHYRQDWDWTDNGLAAAADWLARWRRAVALGSGDPGASAGSAGVASLGGPAGPAGLGGPAGPAGLGGPAGLAGPAGASGRPRTARADARREPVQAAEPV